MTECHCIYCEYGEEIAEAALEALETQRSVCELGNTNGCLKYPDCDCYKRIAVQPTGDA